MVVAPDNAIQCFAGFSVWIVLACFVWLVKYSPGRCPAQQSATEDNGVRNWHKFTELIEFKLTSFIPRLASL